MKTDWLGNTYDVGDLVLYAAMSGRSVTMVLAEVIKFNESGSVGLRPMRSARWKQHSGKSYHIDNRTGKRIDPYSGDGKHITVHGHMAHRDNPQWTISSEEYHNIRWSNIARSSQGYITSGGGKNDITAYDYVPTQFKDYVEHKREDTKLVTISVTENIVKWSGELPEESEDGSVSS